VLGFGVVTAIAAIHVLCEANPSLGTSIVNGFLAWATVLGGFTALMSGLPAAIAVFVPVSPAVRANAINLGVGRGFLVGMAAGPLTLFVFIDRLVT
jgi:hypothetical protein